MKTYFYQQLSDKKRTELCKRSGIDFEKILPMIRDVRENIKKRGDAAVSEYTLKFDQVDLKTFAISNEEFERAEKLVSEDFKQAIKTAAQNIRTFHETQVLDVKKVETTPGVICWRESRAIESVGLYIPGGTAPLFSTILMTSIPAQIAGCKNIILSTPPQKDGSICPEMLWTAQYVGCTQVFKIGGAQAIFSMSEGTEQVPKVDKIFGPGNQYVTAAKMVASETVAIDMPAGPSEVLVIATNETNANFVAADLLSQAEHGPDSEAILVTNSEKKAKEILLAVDQQLAQLPRKDVAKQSLERSYVVITETLEEAFAFSNEYAPEHLILGFENYEPWLSKIINAGSVFCGPSTCESFGDYASGTNHVLPTSGFARNFSGVSVDSFLKKITFQNVSKMGCKNLGNTVELLAEKEELFAHKNAVTLRLNSLQK